MHTDSALYSAISLVWVAMNGIGLGWLLSVAVKAQEGYVTTSSHQQGSCAHWTFRYLYCCRLLGAGGQGVSVVSVVQMHQQEHQIGSTSVFPPKLALSPAPPLLLCSNSTGDGKSGKHNCPALLTTAGG